MSGSKIISTVSSVVIEFVLFTLASRPSRSAVNLHQSLSISMAHFLRGSGRVLEIDKMHKGNMKVQLAEKLSGSSTAKAAGSATTSIPFLRMESEKQETDRAELNVSGSRRTYVNGLQEGRFASSLVQDDTSPPLSRSRRAPRLFRRLVWPPRNR